MSDPGASIEIVVQRSAAAFYLAHSNPWFSVDDRPPEAGRWGTNVVSVLPGHHRVEVWAGTDHEVGRTPVDVEVFPGCVTQVNWRAPVKGFGRGRATTSTRLAVVDVRQPAGWYDDPTGRWDQRWWDGTDWTNHVQRDGTVVHDVE